MITFDSTDALKEWIRDRRHETGARRLSQQEYAARCRAYDVGVQWLSRGVAASPLDQEAIRIYKQAGTANVPNGGTAPLRTTLNKITEQVRRIQAGTAPRMLDVHSTPGMGVGRPQDVVSGDAMEAIANAVIECSGMYGVARRANFERCVDGMHGMGYRIERSVKDGKIDMRLQCFNFNGYQLTLDPLNMDPNLYNHEYVIFSEVVTEHAARRRYGDDQMGKIDTKGLREVGQLMPVERKFHTLTGGQVFPEIAQNSKARGLVVHTVFLRGEGKRFDRMYTVLDTVGGKNDSNRSFQIVNWDANQNGFGNPYGGVGLPLFCLYGHPRSQDLHGVSDVGMMIDSQDKLNIAASIYFQSLWNYVQKVLFVDRRALEDSKIKPTDIARQMRQGMLFLNIRSKDSFVPQVAQMPQPPQAVAQDMDRFTQDLREAGMKSAAHAGQQKSHVADQTVERVVELSEIASEDRVDTDIAEYEKMVESLASTQVRLVQAMYPSAIRLVREAGLGDEQIGRIRRIDPFRQLPRLKLAEEAIRRRSRSSVKRDINLLAQSGAFANDPGMMARLLNGLDMPVSEHDRVMRQSAEIAAARAAESGEFTPYPMGQYAPYIVEALQRAAAQTSDPATKQMLTQFIMLQQQTEIQAAGGGAQQQPEAEVTLQDLVANFGPTDAA